MLEATGRVGVLRLVCTWPLDEDLILTRPAKASHVLFAEEVGPFIETEVKALAAQLGIKHFFGKASSGHLPLIGELTPGKLAPRPWPASWG